MHLSTVLLNNFFIFFIDLDNSAANEELKFSVLKRLPEVMLTFPAFYLMLFNKYVPVVHLMILNIFKNTKMSLSLKVYVMFSPTVQNNAL